MAVVIRLMRAGMKKRPFYRVVVADSRRQRDGRFIEILGHYDPIPNPHVLKVEKEKVESWIAKGARPSEQVASLLRSLGVRMVNPSQSNKASGTPAEKPAKAAKAAAKPAARRAAPKAESARKVKAKAVRASGKKKPAVKKPKKKRT
jgi:small subunit ribosomal protein S16